MRSLGIVRPAAVALKMCGRLLPLVCLSIYVLLGSAAAQQTEPNKLFPIFENGKLGYINQTGEVVIEPRFEQVNQKD